MLVVPSFTRRRHIVIMTSITLTLVGKSSVLTGTYSPPIELDPQEKYALGLIGFYSFHSVFNIDDTNNKFYLIGVKVPITIPKGSYELKDLEEAVCSQLPDKKSVSIKANKLTQRCEIKSNTFDIDFTQTDTFRDLLGFDQPITLSANQLHTSTNRINISKVRTVRISCNITAGAYLNNKPNHSIHEFSIEVEPGYAISEVPHNIIYLPITVSSLNTVIVRITDQHERLINFQGEEIVVRLEFKKN